MPSPTRRRLLAAAGAAALAGCLQQPGATDAPTDTEADGTSSLSSPLGAADPDACPAYGDRVDRVVCYDDVDPERGAVVLEPDPQSAGDGESITFTLGNGTDERLATNLYDWRVDKDVDGEWHHVAPMGHNDPLTYLDPGANHTWTVTIDQTEVEDGETAFESGGTDAVTLRAVGAGTYAFRARGWFETDSYDDTLAFAATFDVESDSLELTPSNAITETTWEDDVLVATSMRGDPDDDGQRPGAFELERGVDHKAATNEDERGPRSMITEQLFREPRLRDAIALSLEHDAERVRLEEFDGAHPIFGGRVEGSYEYDGEYYRVETREIET